MRTKPFPVVAAVFCYLISMGCARAKPDEASLSEVAHCHFLNTVDGSSGYGKNAGWMPFAKASAEKKAGEIGATHIVWTHSHATGTFNGAISARAYSCKR